MLLLPAMSSIALFSQGFKSEARGSRRKPSKVRKTILPTVAITLSKGGKASFRPSELLTKTNRHTNEMKEHPHFRRRHTVVKRLSVEGPGKSYLRPLTAPSSLSLSGVFIAAPRHNLKYTPSSTIRERCKFRPRFEILDTSMLPICCVNRSEIRF